MARKIRTDSIFNASLEKWEIQVNTKVYTFLPREITQVPEEVTPILEMEYAAKGIIAVYPGDDFKAKERQALIAYLETINNRIQNYQSEFDEAKRRGVTMEAASAWTRAKRWKEEILTKLNMEAPLEEEKSFLAEEDMKPNMFASMPVVETVEKIVKAAPKKTKISSFLDTNVETELGA